MKVFGAIGRIGSGKDECLDYLAGKMGLPVLSIGDRVRELAAERGLPATRENLHRLSLEIRRERGETFFMEEALRRIRDHRWKGCGIAGVRTSGDVRFLKSRLGEHFLLFHVFVDDPHLRFERVRRRGSRRDPPRYEDFLKQDREEEELFHLREASSLADVSLDNSGTLEELHRRIDAVLAGERAGGRAVAISREAAGDAL